MMNTHSTDARDQFLHVNHTTFPNGTSAATLSPRQRDVLAALQAGQSEKEVALRLGLSQHTVHVHIRMIYKRMNVCSRGELLSLWINPEVSPPPNPPYFKEGFDTDCGC